MKKICLQCKKEFKKAYSTSKRTFAKQKYCGQKCFSISVSGKKRGPMSEETKKKIGQQNKGNMTGIKNGEKTRFKKGQPSSRRGKKFPQISGDKHYAWKGGISTINEKIRHSLEYRLWRETVFKRDNYTCVWCGTKSRIGLSVVLHADHIKPFSKYPELRFAIDNGRTLCVQCHRTTDTYGFKLLK
jgi:hypothetical protein